MAEFDFAIHGTDLFSGLLAGLLARDHGKKVVRIGRRPSTQRLWRSLPLALPLATRPASWTVVRRANEETASVLGSIGVPGALQTIETSVLADTADTTVALDHLAHVAMGIGQQVRRIERGWSFRRVPIIDRDLMDARLEEWLAATGVASVDDGPADAALSILADDAALLDILGEAQRPPALVSQAMLATLIVAPRALPVPVQLFPDRGVTLVARPGSTVLALVSGERDAEARLASTLAGPFPMKRLATTRYRRIISTDGAPMIGRMKGTKQFIVSGLGACAPFMAPAIARLLAGQSEGAEKSWFAAHDPSRPREAVADFVAGLEVQP
jgi:hypothetical protein